jgi:hypothetical protein
VYESAVQCCVWHHTSWKYDRSSMLLELYQMHDLCSKLEQSQSSIVKVGFGSVRELSKLMACVPNLLDIYHSNPTQPNPTQPSPVQCINFMLATVECMSEWSHTSNQNVGQSIQCRQLHRLESHVLTYLRHYDATDLTCKVIAHRRSSKQQQQQPGQ